MHAGHSATELNVLYNPQSFGAAAAMARCLERAVGLRHVSAGEGIFWNPSKGVDAHLVHSASSSCSLQRCHATDVCSAAQRGVTALPHRCHRQSQRAETETTGSDNKDDSAAGMSTGRHAGPFRRTDSGGILGAALLIAVTMSEH